MNEVVKTLIFVGTACFFGLVALVMRPSDAEFSLDDIERQVNTPLFPQFSDPGAAVSLEVVKVDEVMGRLERFKVARDVATGRWTIPSHNGYPADAEDQMKQFSATFIDLPIIGIASTVGDEHALYGVVQPDERTADTADGVGVMVSIEDKSGESLVQLIVGKAVRSAEDQRFVRRPGQDVVYVVAIDPEKFSTRFKDWIRRDLLQLNAFDLETVRIEDYTVGGTVRDNALVPDQQQRMEADLRWDSTGGKWSLERLVTFQNRQSVEEQLADDEELNTPKLNELKDAVAAMEIVNVFRKPAGMGANLRTDESFMQDMEALQSLVDKGFYPMRRGTTRDFDLKAANGEVRVGTKDGVEYVLRFGNTAGSQEDDPDKMNRFMFVTARFDESKFPVPEKPVLPTADSATPPSAPDSATSDPEEEEPASEDAPPESDGNEDAEEACAAPQDDEATLLEDEETASLRQQMEAEYQRKLDDREEKIQQGRQRVRELNDRFADWYYVISEDYFKRIHLSRSDLVRAKGSGSGAGGVGGAGGFELPPGFNLPGGLNLPSDLDLPDLDLPDLDLPDLDLPDLDLPDLDLPDLPDLPEVPSVDDPATPEAEAKQPATDDEASESPATDDVSRDNTDSDTDVDTDSEPEPEPEVETETNTDTENSPSEAADGDEPSDQN